MTDTLTTIGWAIEHGAAGVMAIAIMGQSWLLLRLLNENKELHAARIEDHKAFIEVTSTLQDKVHKTVDDLARTTKVIQARKRITNPDDRER